MVRGHHRPLSRPAPPHRPVPRGRCGPGSFPFRRRAARQGSARSSPRRHRLADLTHLDSTALKNFKNTDIADFISDLLDIRKDNPAGVRSLKNLLAETGAGSAAGLANDPCASA
ncbi:type VII secretion system-associated protein [Streptomyces sp. L7]